MRGTFEVRDLPDQGVGIPAGRLRLADFLRNRIPPGLHFLHVRLDFPLVRIEGKKSPGLRRQATTGHGGIKSFRVFPDPF